MTFIPKNPEPFGRPCGVLCFTCTCGKRKNDVNEIRSRYEKIEFTPNELSMIDFADRMKKEIVSQFACNHIMIPNTKAGV